jgi:hypothetical protein
MLWLQRVCLRHSVAAARGHTTVWSQNERTVFRIREAPRPRTYVSPQRDGIIHAPVHATLSWSWFSSEHHGYASALAVCATRPLPDDTQLSPYRRRPARGRDAWKITASLCDTPLAVADRSPRARRPVGVTPHRCSTGAPRRPDGRYAYCKPKYGHPHMQRSTHTFSS